MWKKFAVGAFFALALLFSGCEDDLKNDITIQNNSGRTIGVNLTTSPNTPSSFYTLNNRDSHTFSQMDADDYYIHLSYNSGYFVSKKMYISSTCT